MDKEQGGEKIHEITFLLAKRIVGEASKKCPDGAVIVGFNTEADKKLIALIEPLLEEAKREEQGRHLASLKLAVKQERERIIEYLETHSYKQFETDVDLHLNYRVWQSLKEGS